jgi:hypothetical protein
MMLGLDKPENLNNALVALSVFVSLLAFGVSIWAVRRSGRQFASTNTPDLLMEIEYHIGADRNPHKPASDVPITRSIIGCRVTNPLPDVVLKDTHAEFIAYCGRIRRKKLKLNWKPALYFNEKGYVLIYPHGWNFTGNEISHYLEPIAASPELDLVEATATDSRGETTAYRVLSDEWLHIQITLYYTPARLHSRPRKSQCKSNIRPVWLHDQEKNRILVGWETK